MHVIYGNVFIRFPQRTNLFGSVARLIQSTLSKQTVCMTTIRPTLIAPMRYFHVDSKHKLSQSKSLLANLNNKEHTKLNISKINDLAPIKNVTQPDKADVLLLNKTTDRKGKTLFTIPNILTMSRIVATPFIGYFIFQENYTLAGSLFLYSCVTDFLDGYIARKFDMKSSAGTILDPAADKLLMLVTTLSFTLPPGPQIVPVGIATFIIGRDVLLFINSIFVRYKSLLLKHKKITQSIFWDFYHYPSVEVKPTLISKWNTFFQMCYLGPGVILIILLSQNNETEEDTKISEETEEKNRETPQWFTYFGYFVALTSVLSGFSYIGPSRYRKLTVKILK